MMTFSFVNLSSEEIAVYSFSIVAAAVVTILLSSMILFVSSQMFAEVSRNEEEHNYLNENSKCFKFPSIFDCCTMNLSVIVPAYNEEKRLIPMMEECLSFLNERQKQLPDFRFEIIIVNDGSTDGTAKVASKYTKSLGSDKVRVLNLVKNRGKGGAVRLGVVSSRGAVILFADADGATTFSDIEKLELELNEITGIDYKTNAHHISSSVAIVCGSRAHLEEVAISRRSFFRTFLMYGFQFLVRLFTVNTIKDTQCGFKLFTREAAIQCFYNMHVERWAFDVEILYIAQRFNIPVSEISVNWVEIEGSKIVPIFSWLQMGTDLFMIWLRYFIGAWDIARVSKK